MKISIIGNGVWGKALYSVLQANSRNVLFLEKEKQASNQEVVILSLPTQAIRNALGYISFCKNHKIIINTSKGIEKATHLLPFQIVTAVFGEDVEYFNLFGPSFAKEVVEKMPTIVNVGYAQKTENTQTVKNLFQTNFFRVRLTQSYQALEISGAFKNIYAIGCGLSQGLGFGENTKVKLMMLAMEELQDLYSGLSYSLDKFATCGTIGDLILSCNSNESRNFTFGKLLTRLPVKQALETIGSTVEGYHSLASVDYFKEKARVQLPLASFLSTVVEKDNPQSVAKLFEEFVSTA